MQNPRFNSSISSPASYSPRLPQPSICIPNDITQGQAGRLLQQRAAGNRSARTLPKTPKDLEHLPADCHHPQSILGAGRELFSTSKYSFQQKIPGVSAPEWNKQGGRGAGGNVTSPAPTQGCSLKGKALGTKTKASASLLPAPRPVRGGKCSLQELGQVPGERLQQPQCSTSPAGCELESCSSCDSSL